MLIGVGVLCRFVYYIVSYLYVSYSVSCSGSIASAGEERASLRVFAIVYLLLCGFGWEGFPLPLGAWERLRFYCVTPSGI